MITLTLEARRTIQCATLCCNLLIVVGLRALLVDSKDCSEYAGGRVVDISSYLVDLTS